MICKCPAATALTSIPAVTCTETFGQIQKIAFQRLKSSGTDNAFATGEAANSIQLLASWTSRTSANDSTKIVVSPYIQAPTQEANAPRTFGGGNDTLGGIEIIVGREPNNFTAVFRGVPQSTIKVIKELECEAAAGNLGVYLFNESGLIEGLKVGDDAKPIPILSLFVSDKAHGGLDALDYNNIQFSFMPNYSDDLTIFTPTDFNPLTDL